MFSLVQDFFTDFNWGAGTFILVTPLISLYALFVSPFFLSTCLLNLVCAYFFLLGTTAGYHRLWAHKSYEANRAVKAVLAVLGAAAFSMSVVDWVKDHRAHHKYTDTDKDPYNAKRGFWFSHVGWLLKTRIEPPNSTVPDIMADPFLRFQHTFFLPMAFLVGWGIPILISGLGWGDWEGGFYVAVIRTVLLHHAIFAVNSWGHISGDHVYSDRLTAKESPLLALITNGEGYHNFHHEFPNDYRNGVNWYAYDPTKWFISTLQFFGLAWDLNRTPDDVIDKAKIQTAFKQLQARSEKHFWGKPISSLPVYTRDQVKKEVAEKNYLVIMNNIVYDVNEFLPLHPGGEAILRPYLGKDITKEFLGSVYQHSYSANNILDTLRVGRLTNDSRCQ